MPSRQYKGRTLMGAAVVLVIAVTPTILDAWRAWIETPEHRWLIVTAYVAAVVIAVSAADMLIG